MVCAGALSLWVGQRLSGPLTAMAAAMTRLAAGDLDARPPVLNRRDEIGAIAQAMGVPRHGNAPW